jgi:hypothetical protein
LIVNDGSPLPDADKLLQRLRQHDPRIKVFSKKNGGLSSARNYGVQNATGEYVLFLDADNILRPDYAATGVEVLDRHPELVFVVPHVQFFDDTTAAQVGVYNPIPFDRATGLLINRFGDAGAMFRRSIFVEDDVAYDEVLVAYEDWALWMDLECKGLRGEVIPRILYDYRVRRVSMVSQEGVSNHKELMGLLIDRHFPVVDPREKDVLVTLFQTAGHAINEIMRGRPESVDSLHRFKQKLVYAGRNMPGVVKRLYILAKYAVQILKRRRCRVVLREHLPGENVGFRMARPRSRD